MRPSLPIRSLLFALGMCLSFAGVATALPVTFTFEGRGQGVIGDQAFGLDSFTITAYADTENIILAADAPFPSSGVDTIPLSSASLSVAGMPTAQITDPTAIFISRANEILGLQSISGPFSFFLDIIDIQCGASCSSYDLTTSFGPVATPIPSAVEQFQNVSSDRGPISFDGMFATTFQATVGSPPIPEPSGALLFGLGLSAVSLTRKSLTKRG